MAVSGQLARLAGRAVGVEPPEEGTERRVMACEIVSTSGGVFALWGLPTRDDVDLVVGALREAATACGHPVVYVTRVPPSAPVPDRDTRHHLEAIMPTVAPCFSSYHVVLEGVGFAAALKR